MRLKLVRDSERQQHETERNEIKTRIEKILARFDGLGPELRFGHADRAECKPTAAEWMMKGINVEIMGQSLTVMSDSGDEWAKTLAATVDEKINYIRANSRAVNSVSVAILAALNFADELERLKRDHQELIDQIEALNRRLSLAMDS